MDEIQVFDDIFPLKFIDDIYELILHRKVPYDFLYNLLDANIRDEALVGLQHILFDYQHQPISSYFNTYLLNILYETSHYINLTPLNYYRGRIFIQPPRDNPVESGIHTDLDFNHLVCLYYVNDTDGDTIFYNNDLKTEIKRTSPKKGRVVIFNGTIPHSATTPTKLPRAIINFNFSV
jgi:hypothetical protein